jgi:hypothetical protein
MLLDLAVAVEPRCWEFVWGLKKKFLKKAKKEVQNMKDDLISQKSES